MKNISSLMFTLRYNPFLKIQKVSHSPKKPTENSNPKVTKRMYNLTLHTRMTAKNNSNTPVQRRRNSGSSYGLLILQCRSRAGRLSPPSTKGALCAWSNETIRITNPPEKRGRGSLARALALAMVRSH